MKNKPSTIEALDLLPELIEAIEETCGAGLSYKEASDILEMEYNRFHLCASQLIYMKKIKGVKSAKGTRLVMPDWPDPDIYVVSPRQRKVLEYLIANMDEANLIRVSFRQIIAATGSGSDTIERLDYKGFLEIVERGTSIRAALYRIYPGQDGLRGHSWFPKDGKTKLEFEQHRRLLWK